MADDQFVFELKATLTEFPSFKIVHKRNSAFMKFLAILLFFNKRFMTDYHTTIGDSLYAGDSWDSFSAKTKAALIRHERVHLRQQKKYGKFFFAIMYLFLPLPFIVQTWRARFEMEAYEESILARCEYWGPDSFGEGYKEETIKIFTGPDYMWMWTDRRGVEAWYNHAIARAKWLSRQPSA